MVKREKGENAKNGSIWPNFLKCQLDFFDNRRPQTPQPNIQKSPFGLKKTPQKFHHVKPGDGTRCKNSKNADFGLFLGNLSTSSSTGTPPTPLNQAARGTYWVSRNHKKKSSTARQGLLPLSPQLATPRAKKSKKAKFGQNLHF